MIKVSAFEKYNCDLVKEDVVVNYFAPMDGIHQTSKIIKEFGWRNVTSYDKETLRTDERVEYNDDHSKWRPSMQWLMAQEDKNKQEDEMIELKEISNLDQDIASIKERELHKSPIIPFEPLTKTLTKKDYLISKAADSLTHTQYMHFMSIVDVLIDKGVI